MKTKKQHQEAINLYGNSAFARIPSLIKKDHPCQCGHMKDEHQSLDSRPFGKWNCTYCQCEEYEYAK